MFSFLSQLRVKKQAVRLVLTVSAVFAPLGVSALEEVTVIGVSGGLWGLDYHEYLSNASTANELRALYEGMVAQAAAEARAAAEKEKSEEEQAKTEREQCEARAVIKDALCLRDAVSYKLEKNKACQLLQSTVGNIPYGNPAGACFGRVLDSYDLFVANCALFNATNMYACIK